MDIRLPSSDHKHPATWRPRAVRGLVLLALALVPATVLSQATVATPVGLSREQLTERADSLHALLASSSLGDDERRRVSEAESAVRQRLQAGDFLVGDRIVVSVLGSRELSDTFTVRQNRELTLPNLPPLSLQGVLRSEASSRIADFVGRYVRDAQVTVTPLLRLSVEGAVVRPGFYSVRSDALLSDVIMEAGGPAPNSDVSKTVVRRDGALYWGTSYLAPKLYGGATVDALGLRSGDQVVVPEVHRRNISNTIQLGVAILTAAAVLITLGRSH